MKKPRRQCRTCPWKVGADPYQIPRYDPALHAKLTCTIAEPETLVPAEPGHIMSCHYSKPGKEKPCVGWLSNQLGPGNNILLRLAVMTNRIDGNIETVGPQHETFEETLP